MMFVVQHSKTTMVSVHQKHKFLEPVGWSWASIFKYACHTSSVAAPASFYFKLFENATLGKEKHR